MFSMIPLEEVSHMSDLQGAAYLLSRSMSKAWAITVYAPDRGDTLATMKADARGHLAKVLEHARALGIDPTQPAQVEAPADSSLDVEIGLGSPHGDPAGSGDLAIRAEPSVVAFPERGVNFRTVGSFGAGEPSNEQPGAA